MKKGKGPEEGKRGGEGRGEEEAGRTESCSATGAGQKGEGREVAGVGQGEEVGSRGYREGSYWGRAVMSQ